VSLFDRLKSPLSRSLVPPVPAAESCVWSTETSMGNQFACAKWNVERLMVAITEPSLPWCDRGLVHRMNRQISITQTTLSGECRMPLKERGGPNDCFYYPIIHCAFRLLGAKSPSAHSLHSQVRRSPYSMLGQQIGRSKCLRRRRAELALGASMGALLSWLQRASASR
jgi:hypothetical protein